MACSEPNCNSACKCNQCCPPTSIPTPPTPPTCEGTQCDEVYDGACVNYTGAAIPCIGIQPGASLNTVIQLLANQVCDCCDKPKCKNPLEFIFEYYTQVVNRLDLDNEKLTFEGVLYGILSNGLVLPSCGLCCPDSEIWGFGETEAFYNVYNVVDPQYNIGINSNTNYTNCLLEIVKVKEPGIAPPVSLYDTSNVQEYGSLLANTQLCTILDFCQSYISPDPYVAQSLFNQLKYNGIFISCIGNNGEMFIGNANAFLNYYNSTTRCCNNGV
jgi:hypothetical protein